MAFDEKQIAPATLAAIPMIIDRKLESLNEDGSCGSVKATDCARKLAESEKAFEYCRKMGYISPNISIKLTPPMSSETYKGIEFVRIANLPSEEQQRIVKTLDQTRIIKILRDKELLNDCVLVDDYNNWLKNQPLPTLQ